MLVINLLIILLISSGITFLLIKYKNNINLIAHPNYRTMHKNKIPNSGGIAIFISFFLGIYLLDINLDSSIYISMILVFLLGVYDDIFVSKIKEKLVILFLIANILYFHGYNIQYLGTYLGYSIELPSFLAYWFLVFIVIGFVNSINLIDGLDGLVSIVGIIILGSFLYIGLKFKDDFLIYIASIYISSIVGYLFFNWSPAKIFMGDNGSFPLGLIIVIVAVHAVNMKYITPISILMLSALPILDTFIVMTNRIKLGQNPFVADKSHIHHIIFQQQKNNTKRTVTILALMQVVFSYIGLGFKIRDDILILILFLMILVLIYMLLIPKKS